MADIKKELNSIKNAVYGREVRGSIHDGIKKINEESEESKQKAEEAHEITQDLLDETFDSAALEANFEQRLNDEIANLQPEWTGFKNDVTTRLANIENLENYELQSKGRTKKGHIVFISDDFHKGDWEILKPIFESAGVPFCLAVVTDWMEPGHPNYETRGTWEQLEYLQNEMGCEILSHSKTHNSPKSLIEMTESELRYELSESRNELIRRGFDVQSFRVPGNQSDIKVRKIAREYYRAMVVSNQGDMNNMNYQPYETYDLKSIWLDNESYGGAKSFDYYKEHIDRANEEGALLIISTHGYALDGVEELMEQVVQYAKSTSRVTTLREALNASGNIIEIGDYSRSKRPDRIGGKHFVVGADGTVSGGVYIAELDEFNNDTRWEYFPFGVTVCPITSGNAEGLPKNSPGTMINYKTRIQQFSYNYQEFIAHRTNERFIRFLNSDGGFTEWISDNPIFIWDNNKGRFDSGIDYYNVGVTYEYVMSNNLDIEQAPEQRPGVRITHKLTDGEPWGFNYQEYRLTYDSGGERVYIRRATGPDTWSEWTDSTSYSRVDNESYDLNSGIIDFPLGQTMTYIESNNPTINKAPEESSGTLITYRVRESGSWGFNYQEYHLNFKANRLSVYKRRAESATTWGDWVLVSKE